MFQKAVKTESKLRLAFTGPAGSGKTYSALAVASALGSRIALLDTEHGSAAKYADIFQFDTAELHPPFHPDRYAEAIKDAAAAGYDVLILDSMSHAWTGTGGMLDVVNEIARAKYNNNTFMAWKDGTPIQNRLIEAILAAPIHIIATMRSKTDYIVETNEKGKQQPRKVGTAPVQRDGFEYEYDIIIDMGIDNMGVVNKTRCPALAGKVIDKPGKPLADVLRDWLKGATPAPKVIPPQPRPNTTDIREGGSAVVGAAPLPDDELVISEASAKEFVTTAAALLSTDTEDLKARMKALGYTGIPGHRDERMAAYRALKAQPAAGEQPDLFSPEDEAAREAAPATAQGQMS